MEPGTEIKVPILRAPQPGEPLPPSTRDNDPFSKIASKVALDAAERTVDKMITATKDVVGAVKESDERRQTEALASEKESSEKGRVFTKEMTTLRGFQGFGLLGFAIALLVALHWISKDDLIQPLVTPVLLTGLGLILTAPGEKRSKKDA